MQRLIDRASDGQVIHCDLSQHTLGIDQIARAQRDPLVLDQTPVLTCNAHAAVGQQWDAQIGPKPPAARGCCAQVWCEYSESVEMAASACDDTSRVMSVALHVVPQKRVSGRRRTEHGGVYACEVRKRVVEREDLGWADKRKVASRRKHEIGRGSGTLSR
jgi:hypothetical protein